MYDNNFNEIIVNDLDSNNNEHIIHQLQIGTYYLELINTSTLANTITLDILAYNSYYLGSSDNNGLINTYNYNQGINTYNYYRYNIYGGYIGLYKFTITGVKSDNTLVTYPSNVISIKDQTNETIINTYSLNNFSNESINGYEANTFIAYLYEEGYYYVYINIDTDNLNSLTIKVESVDSETIDLFTKSESTDSYINILDNETTSGNYAKMITLKQASKFIINCTYNGNQVNNIFFSLNKLNYDNEIKTYTIDTLISQTINSTNNTFANTLILTDGIYFITYFNKEDSASLDITFNRLITQYGSESLVTDPDVATPCGSQISIVEINRSNKSYRETYITKGFTRIIYIDYNYEIPASRLKYYWYSSDEDIAEVTAYGTVLGKKIGSVKIMAVLKSDPSKTFIKDFTIINDIYSNEQIIESSVEIKLSDIQNGKFTLPLDKVNCPFPRFQDYIWTIDKTCDGTTYDVSYNEWGIFTVNDTGCFTLTGRYKENSRITIVVHVVIIND